MIMVARLGGGMRPGMWERNVIDSLAMRNGTRGQDHLLKLTQREEAPWNQWTGLSLEIYLDSL
jgi:hypothetical protein